MRYVYLAIVVLALAALVTFKLQNLQPKSGSYPVAGRPAAGRGGPTIGAMRSLT